ncbi:MAG: peptidoglycan-binding domain-containing protein [Alphaproteobacteria bacterium]
MKYAIGAVAAVALGFSMAVSAQAQTPQHQTNSSPNMAAPAAPGSKQANAGHAISQKAQIKQAQQALKDEGLYQGKIDGKWGHESRQALMQFEKRNNLPATGRLDSNTFAALTQSTSPASIGSSVPNGQGSGQTNMHPYTPPAQTAPNTGGNGAAGAGGTQH